MNEFAALAYDSIDDFVYGTAPRPVRARNGLAIGAGAVYPEINFTLPAMTIDASTMPEVLAHYAEMTEGVLKRAVELQAPGLILEIELLPPTTLQPAWGMEIHKLVRDRMHAFESAFGLKSALRITPSDVRDIVRPPVMRRGEVWEAMLRTFEGCARDGADFLAIESTGGKEVHDDALVNADLPKVLFALGVMGVRDMQFLWTQIVSIADETGSIAAGDTACGFGNTAMVLAERGFIPKVFAAVVRVATVARSLAAYEMGARGPSKDCAYEGPYLKAIAGVPIAMEGKASACAHFSPVGNIAAAVADLWSNESVQNVKLLSGMAPVVSLEQLVYDCRLMNEAAREGREGVLRLQKWLTDSDARLDPQAYVLRPDIVFGISREIVRAKTPFQRTVRAAEAAVEALRGGLARGALAVPERELPYLDVMSRQLERIPADEEELWRELKGELERETFIPSEYGLS